MFRSNLCLLLLSITGCTLARDLSLHFVQVGYDENDPEPNQRSLREIDPQDTMTSRRVDLSLLRQAMNGGPALESFTSLDLPDNVNKPSSESSPVSLITIDQTGQREEEDIRSLKQVEGGAHDRNEPETDKPKPAIVTTTTPANLYQFDFIVGGFPKCGTTTLLKAFGANPETDMVPQEQCAIAAPSQADHLVVSRLKSTLSDMSTIRAGSTWHKQGFKCPTAIYNYKSISRLEKHSPNAKIIIGIRHPIHMLQSFYNYRVTELYERGQRGEETIPSFSDLMKDDAEPWRGVSIHAVRFEFFLQQLGKTTMDRSQLEQFASFSLYGHELAVKPSNFTIFCYTVDQLEDADDLRSEQFRSSLQQYLGLTTPLAPFGHENKNHAVGSTGHPETIRICDDQFANIRNTAIVNARTTADWIRNEFLQARDVFVANPEHFLETVQQWETDPCQSAFIQ